MRPFDNDDDEWVGKPFCICGDQVATVHTECYAMMDAKQKKQYPRLRGERFDSDESSL